MYNVLESTFLSKELYKTILAPVCTKYDISQTEMIILLFIASNPERTTATEVIKARRLTKSSVSMAVRSLQEKGYLCGEYIGGNHRSIYLKLCDKASDIIEDGTKAQNSFLSILTEGFTEDEISLIKNNHERMLDNIRRHLIESKDHIRQAHTSD